jgi:hypothetical protein
MNMVLREWIGRKGYCISVYKGKERERESERVYAELGVDRERE